jgi:hypothetical protein
MQNVPFSTPNPNGTPPTSVGLVRER